MPKKAMNKRIPLMNSVTTIHERDYHFRNLTQYSIMRSSVLQLLEPEPLGLNPQKWLTYWLFSCFPLAA